MDKIAKFKMSRSLTFDEQTEVVNSQIPVIEKRYGLKVDNYKIGTTNNEQTGENDFIDNTFTVVFYLT